MNTNYDFHSEESVDEQEEKKQGIVSRVFQGIVVLLVLAGLVYSSGFYQYFFFQRTPASVEQAPVETAIDAEQIQVPLTLFIISNDGANGSERSAEDVRRLVENANRIWEQANIKLVFEHIYVVERNDAEIQLLYFSPIHFAQGIEELDGNTINVLLLGNLQGLNGVAFGGTPTIAVADYTTVYDFRVLAHEIGHKLNLGHVPVDRTRLMYQGANGAMLTLEEIMRSRASAERF